MRIGRAPAPDWSVNISEGFQTGEKQPESHFSSNFTHLQRTLQVIAGKNTYYHPLNFIRRLCSWLIVELSLKTKEKNNNLHAKKIESFFLWWRIQEYFGKGMVIGGGH